jgi:hypothetical protein
VRRKHAAVAARRKIGAAELIDDSKAPAAP